MGQKVVLTGFLSGEVRSQPDNNILAFDMEMAGVKSPPKGLPTSDGVIYTVLCTEKQLIKANLSIETLPTTKLMIQGELTLDLSTSVCYGDVGLICMQLSVIEDKPKESESKKEKEVSSSSGEKTPDQPKKEKQQQPVKPEKPPEPVYEDIVLSCVDCGGEVIFTAEQQKRYTIKGLEPPERCLPCHLKLRQYLREHPEECTDGPITDFDYLCADCGAWVKLPAEFKDGRKIYCRKCIKIREKARATKPPEKVNEKGIYIHQEEYNSHPFKTEVPGVVVPQIPVGIAPEGTKEWVDISLIKVPRTFNFMSQEKTQKALEKLIETGTIDEPILVNKDLVLQDGWRRLWMVSKAGWDKVPVKRAG